MTSKLFHSLCVLTLLVLSACGGSRPPIRPPVKPPDVPPVIEPICCVDLNVHVYSAGTRPLAGATVTLDTGDTRLSGEDGIVNFGIVQALARTITVTAQAYQPATTTVDVATDNIDVDVVLVSLVPDRPRQIRGRLQAQGRALTYPDGAKFNWRFLTGFQLLEQVAHGRAGEARAYLKWARDTGFNGVRVLTMADGLFKLSPQDGLSALSAFLALSYEEDLYVELVALADTRAYAMSDGQMRDHVRAVGRIAAGFEHTVLQAANEHYHSTQQSSLYSLAFVNGLVNEMPPGVLYTLSTAADDEATEPQGQYVTRHLDRARDQWNNVRRVRELERLSEQAGKPVINDEPIGANEVEIQGRRLADPEAFFGLAVLGRIFEVGTTFHFDDGLFARLPRPIQALAAQAFIDGATLWPDDVQLRFVNTNPGSGPTAKACFIDPGPASKPDCATVIRVFNGVLGNRGYTVAVGVRGPPGIDWQNGWHIVKTLAQRPGVVVWEIAR